MVDLDEIDSINVDECYKPRSGNMIESPIIDQGPSNYKLKLKYGGYFRLSKSSSRQIYCFPKQKTISVNACSYELKDLIDEVKKLFPIESNQVVSMLFEERNVKEQTFIPLNTDDDFFLMLSMYEDKKEVTIFVAEKNEQENESRNPNKERDNEFLMLENVDKPRDEEGSDIYPSEQSYHSVCSSESEDEIAMYERETYSYNKNEPVMEVNSKFPNVDIFRKAMNQYVILKEFDYLIVKSDNERFTAKCVDRDCKWRVHASVLQDDITFEVKTLNDVHTCTRRNKSGNKRATQGWIADRVVDKLKAEGDVSTSVLKKWLCEKYNVDLTYLKVYRGREQALKEIYDAWEDSFLKIEDYKEELLRRNPGSVVDMYVEKIENKNCFQRFFVSLGACSTGFVLGCRPCIGVDACHLKGKFKGVLASATAVDGNSGMFLVAYGVLESKNTNSWVWFLTALHQAIGTPEGLVICSDMQKGLGIAVAQVYPNAEHQECMRHLYSNFKKRFGGEFIRNSLWEAACTYSLNHYNRLMDEIHKVRPDAIAFLEKEHNKIWSRCKFGTTAKCDYLTNNISEAFNAWINEATSSCA